MSMIDDDETLVSLRTSRQMKICGSGKIMNLGCCGHSESEVEIIGIM